jgi:hypothetical protein
MTGNNVTLIHVGFCHSGTTSLQQNFFSRRPDIFCCTSVGNCGGIFSLIKYEENASYVDRRVKPLIDQYVSRNMSPGQKLVLSDETLVEQPEVYYTPHKLPVGLIAQRLKRFFPNAQILFTLRNQFDYVVSCYFNLKRNYAHFANRNIEDFDAWFAGNHSQLANLFLRNLDYSRAIGTFESVFGKHAVSVLPLEALPILGEKGYLTRIGNLIGAEITEVDAKRFAVVRNKRMSRAEDAIATTWRFPAARRSLNRLVQTYQACFGVHSPAAVHLTDDQIALIRERCAEGNSFLQDEFGIDLAGLGYPTIERMDRARLYAEDRHLERHMVGAL